MSRQPRVQVVHTTENELVQRVTRSPQHTFQVEHVPFDIQPFMIAPVLPGDTLKNVLLQSRVVTDPVKNPLIGWWIEHYLFYVKLTDLDDRDTFTALMLSTTANLSAGTFYGTADNPALYFNPGTSSAYDFVGACLKRVTETYFRDDGESWTADTGTTGIPKAKTGRSDWLDSLVLDGVESTPDDLRGTEPGYVEDQSAAYQEMYDRMRMMRLTTFTYEEWLRDQGIRGIQAEKPHRPELIRFSREWQYPSNTVNPADGTVASAVSWSIQERADKDRFFKEPGFVFGVTVARPKIYMSAQVLPAVSMLSDALSWLPAALRERPELSLRKFVDTDGPLRIGTTGSKSYWVDIRDLFVYGDQFCNFALTETDNGLVALPNTTTYDRSYPSNASIAALFKTGTSNKVRQDGVARLGLLGSVRDNT